MRSARVKSLFLRAAWRALAFAHLALIDEQVPRVHPVPRELAVRRAFGLGNLTLVGEDVVFAAGVNVESGAKITQAHGRALDVPTRKAA
jgi:hypothetical protein